MTTERGSFIHSTFGAIDLTFANIIGVGLDILGEKGGMI